MDEDLAYALTRKRLTEEEVRRLAKDLKKAHIQFNASTLVKTIEVDGYLQKVTPENAWHLRQLAEARLMAYL